MLKRNKGITLIALVITVIVLIILAGVAISMLSGDNGLLTKAAEAREKTEQAAYEENLSLAITQYYMDNNREETLEEFLQDENKSGLENVKIYSDDAENVIGTYNDKVFYIDENNNIEIYNENLVTNGFLEMGSNKNFANMTYNEDGYLSYESDYGATMISSEFIAIDPNKEYFQSVTVKSSNDNARYYVGIYEYDEDKNLIYGYNYTYTNNTLTELAQDLNNGDTKIYIKDISNFKQNDNRGGIIFWNYKNNNGYQYPPLTYSRNAWNAPLYTNDGIDFENNIINLIEPWDKGTFQKGTQLSQGNANYIGSYNYGVLNYKTLSNNWTTYSNTITGTNEGGAIRESWKKFRYPTKYIKILFILNYDNEENVTTDIKNIVFCEK